MAHTRIRRRHPGYSGPTEVCLFVRVEKERGRQLQYDMCPTTVLQIGPLLTSH